MFSPAIGLIEYSSIEFRWLFLNDLWILCPSSICFHSIPEEKLWHINAVVYSLPVYEATLDWYNLYYETHAILKKQLWYFTSKKKFVSLLVERDNLVIAVATLKMVQKICESSETFLEKWVFVVVCSMFIFFFLLWKKKKRFCRNSSRVRACFRFRYTETRKIVVKFIHWNSANRFVEEMKIETERKTKGQRESKKSVKVI